MIQSIFHVNVNVTDFERSLAFYQMLGFRVVADLGAVGGPSTEALGIPGARGRAALLLLGDDPRATRIDLIEWREPPPDGKPYPHLAHPGICRIALRTKNLRQVYDDLRAKGVRFLSEPSEIQTPAGPALFVCFTDPDGTFLELIEV